jgi:ATP-dependent RNA helicase SUPV3L1/SUV3
VGFRICGERCVRIDMLERLADTIRDRVFWKPRFEGEARPAGSVEGGGFTVVPDMMSLVGCSGEEFAGILRSLGYRSETRAVAPEPVAAPAPPAAPAPVEPSGWDETALAEPAPAEPAADAAPESATPVAEAAGEPASAVAEPEPVVAESAPGAADDGAPAPGGTDVGEASQPKEIVVWWPKDTGPFRRRKPEGRPEGQRNRRPRRGPPGVAPAVEGGAPGAPADATAAPEGERRPRQGRGRNRNRNREDEGAQRADRGDRAERPAGDAPRPPRQQGDKRRDDRNRGDKRRDDRKPGGAEPRRYEAAPPAADRAADSPFAVLGALKEKLARGQ